MRSGYPISSNDLAIFGTYLLFAPKIDANLAGSKDLTNQKHWICVDAIRLIIRFFQHHTNYWPSSQLWLLRQSKKECRYCTVRAKPKTAGTFWSYSCWTTTGSIVLSWLVDFPSELTCIRFRLRGSSPKTGALCDTSMVVDKTSCLVAQVTLCILMARMIVLGEWTRNEIRIRI